MISRFSKFILLLDFFIFTSFIFSFANQENEIKLSNFEYFYNNISSKLNQKTAIIVVAYNRPDYLIQVIKSLETNPESQVLPFFFFLDGGSGSKQKENEKAIKNSNIKKKYIIKRDYNYGCGRNLIDARRFIFDWCNFNKVIFFEDDLIISPQYISLTLNLYEWSKKNYCNIGIVQCWENCSFSKEKKLEKLNSVKECYSHMWGYCIDKDVWNDIKLILYEYEKKFLLNVSYKERNHTAIKKWIYSLIKKGKKLKQGILFPSIIDYESWFLNSKCPSSQDTITCLALYLCGYIKLVTEVNRSKYIGVVGLHSNFQIYSAFGFDKVNLDIFTDDNGRKDFIIKN